MFLPTPFDVRIIGSLPTDWWTVIITAGAAVFGAIVGAAISIFVARMAARENREAIHIAQRNAEEGATLRAITKIAELMNAAAGYHFQVEREIAQAKQRHPDKHLEAWQIMVARVGRPHEVHISADDLIAFTKSRSFEYVTELLHWVSQYNSMIFGFEAYSKRRDDLTAMLTPDRIDGELGSGPLTADQLMKVQPHLIGVRTVAEQLRQEAKEVYETGVKLVSRFGPIVRTYFNDPKFPIPAVVKEAKNG